MLDEEVKFERIWKVPEEQLNKDLVKLVDPLSIAGGALGGYILLKYGFDVSNLWSLMFGLPTGFVTGAILGDKLEKKIIKTKNINYIKAEKLEDKKALDDKCLTITFDYRGNKIELPLREEYQQTGKMFYFRINDNEIFDPIFSYQPLREKSITFRFGFRNFKVSSENYKKQTLDRMTETLFQSLNEKLSEQEQTKVKIDEEDAEVKYTKEVTKKVNEKGREYKAIFEQDKKLTYVNLFYTGENFNQNLSQFGNLSSNIMNFTKEFRLFFER